MLHHDIFIRIPEEGMAFIYTIRRAGELVETAIVGSFVDNADEVIAPGYYYGGSQAMD